MKRFLLFFFLLSTVIMAYGQNTDSQRYLQAGDACFERGDYYCAKKNYEASRATGGNVTEQLEYTEECIKILFAANLLFEGGDHTKACELYEQILKINPHDPLVKERMEFCERRYVGGEEVLAVDIIPEQPTPTVYRAAKSPPVNILAEMKANYPALYSQYISGRKMTTFGGFLMLAGIATLSVGIATLEGGDPLELGEDAGIPLVVFGTGLTGGGFGIMVGGGSKKRRAVRAFNRQYYSSQSSSPHFQFNVYPNRVGLAYVF